MRHHIPIRLTAAACALLSALLCAQTPRVQRRKSSTPIAATPSLQQPAAPAPPPTPAELPAQPAQVTFSNGLLTVSAHNSSLNQILRDISLQTRMKITGGVADERVFGIYGPESPAQVLNSLLEGTSSNMMFVGSNGPAPAELVLTPRAGGATPPSPIAITANQDQQSKEPPPNAPYYKGSATEMAPASPPAPPAQPARNSELPTGTHTPQDIFNQLMKMRQQQAQQRTNQQQ